MSKTEPPVTQITTSDDQVSMTFLAEVVNRRHFDRQRLTVSADLCCPPDFPAFAGHFPGQPVLPAVFQLAVVRMLSAELLGLQLLPEKTGRVKFKNMIRPNESVHVEVELQEIDGRWQADFRLQDERHTIATGKLVLSAQKGCNAIRTTLLRDLA